MTDEQAKLYVDELIKNDPSIAEVVASMRSRGRTWIKIWSCFYKSRGSL